MPGMTQQAGPAQGPEWKERGDAFLVVNLTNVGAQVGIE